MDTKRPTTFILGAGFSAEQQFPLMRDLKDRVIHFIEAEQHYRYADHIHPDGNLSAHLKQNEPYDPCCVTNQVLGIGVARLFWCITFFIQRFEDCYTNFAHGLMKSNGAWRVVNFNWDILVEKSLSDIGASWRYSLTPNEGAIPIIKPHGSINWRSFAQDSSIVPQYSGWKPIGVDSTLSYDARHPLENPDLADHNDDLRYCLYPGDPDLPESHADLERLWKDVLGAIQSAEKVVFIGYSLPEDDSYAGSAFRELCKNKAVEAYDPSSTTLERFHKAFPHAKRELLGFKNTPYALRPARTA
jgi:hypothetical protein